MSAPPERPNILCVVNEDTSPLLGCYGDPAACTPALDGLAARGVRFTNCFSVAPVCAPSRFAMITGMYPTGCGPAHHMRASGGIPSWLHGFPTLLRRAGYWCSNNEKTDYNAPIDPAATWDECSDRAHWRNRPAGAPFFAVFNYTFSHESSVFPGARPEVPTSTNPESVRLPAYLPDDPVLRADRARHHDIIAATDRLVGECLGQLAADGLEQDTIVLHYSDHGGVGPRSKRFCYDSGVRIPLIGFFPPRWAHLAPGAPGSTIDDPVGGIDIPPTVLRLAGLPIPDYMQGVPFAGPDREQRRYAFSARDRMDERYDMQRAARDRRFRFVRNYRPDLPYGQHVDYMWQQRGVVQWERLHRAGRLDEVRARFWRPKPTEELYDLTADPDEVDNLASSADHGEVLARMRRALDEHLVDVNDNGFIPEAAAAEGFEESRVSGAYPLTDVLTLAELAIRADPGRMPTFRSRLGDGNEVVRYWAALGYLLLGPPPETAGTLRDRCSRETSAQVRVVLAEALARLGDRDAGVPVLADLLTAHPEPRVRLQAANALDHLGTLARPALPALQRARDDADHYVRRAVDHTATVVGTS